MLLKQKKSWISIFILFQLFYYFFQKYRPYSKKLLTFIYLLFVLKNIKKIDNLDKNKNKKIFINIKYFGLLIPILLDSFSKSLNSTLVNYMYKVNILMAMGLDYDKKFYGNFILGFILLNHSQFKNDVQLTDENTNNEKDEYILLYTIWNFVFSYYNYTKNDRISHYFNACQLIISYYRKHNIRKIYWFEERVYGLAVTLMLNS